MRPRSFFKLLEKFHADRELEDGVVGRKTVQQPEVEKKPDCSWGFRWMEVRKSREQVSVGKSQCRPGLNEPSDLQNMVGNKRDCR